MIVCIIIGVLLSIGVTAFAISEEGLEGFFGGLVISVIVLLICVLPFIAIDKSSGTTIGTITAVDKNFFGTYTIYLKTAENNEDKYCAENEEIVKQAKENVGNKVQLYYGERVGLYHLNQCHQSPIDKIEVK